MIFDYLTNRLSESDFIHMYYEYEETLKENNIIPFEDEYFNENLDILIKDLPRKSCDDRNDVGNKID